MVFNSADSKNKTVRKKSTQATGKKIYRQGQDKTAREAEQKQQRQTMNLEMKKRGRNTSPENCAWSDKGGRITKSHEISIKERDIFHLISEKKVQLAIFIDR